MLVVLFAVLSVRQVRPNISGDGLEYTLMAQAFLDHGTPDITPGDYREVQSYKGDAETNVSEVAGRSSPTASPPFFRDRNGQYYSYHFWFYSLFVAPFLFLIKLFGIATPWAFTVTNLVFTVVASCAICTWRGVGREQRLLLLTLYWSCGTIPYVSWTHPEVFSASLLVVSMVMALSRRYVIAAIAAAMVAQQNPPALFLVAILLVFDFHLNFKKKRSVMPSVRKVMEWSACVAVAFLSIAFFFVHFRVGNLIANSGFTDARLISLERLWSFYFDLCQGAIVLLWPLLVIVPAMLVCGLAGKKLKAEKFVAAMVLVLASIVLAVPSVSATNFNSGASFILRYAYWASIPLLFAVAVLSSDGAGGRAIACIGVVAFSALNISYYKDNWWSYLYYTAAAEKVMNEFPGLYNPVPEIFIERGRHVDGAMNDKAIYYYASNGEVRKVLLNEGYRNVVDFKCKGGKGVDDYVGSTFRVEQGWVYYNLKDGCLAPFGGGGTYEVPPAVGGGDTLSFDDAGSGKLYLTSGWSSPESWGTWSDAPGASIVLPLKKGGIGTISFKANALVSAAHKEQVIDVFANGVSSGSVVLNASSDNRFDVRIRENAWSDTGRSELLTLDFKFRDSVSPKELGISGDDRRLAMGLTSLTLR
ncbi:hypothetical protein AAB992_16495 [Burkholderia contaminans]|uniref:hypothetical protein n=1 Tax=Burkholderia contaminans TaxID=488447 RepID=UPI0024170E77|nr:hypothetical protein [Burkholderia contaminans]WFN10197.1 hypothetical protein LXE92_01805 [Burkholderia contaminans]